MTSGYVYPCTCYLSEWRVFIHISVGFSIACSELKAIPEPVKRNSNNASPAFFVSFSIIYKKLRPTRIKGECYEKIITIPNCIIRHNNTICL